MSECKCMKCSSRSDSSEGDFVFVDEGDRYFLCNKCRIELGCDISFSTKKPKPRLLENPDLKNLRDICQEYIDKLDEDGHSHDDIDHYIFEEAMKTMFGTDVFDWINSQTT